MVNKIEVTSAVSSLSNEYRGNHEFDQVGVIQIINIEIGIKINAKWDHARKDSLRTNKRITGIGKEKRIYTHRGLKNSKAKGFKNREKVQVVSIPQRIPKYPKIPASKNTTNIEDFFIMCGFLERYNTY